MKKLLTADIITAPFTYVKGVLKNAQRAIAKACRLAREERAYLHISDLTGKLTGIPAITTTAIVNERCKKRSLVPGSICSHCYATRRPRTSCFNAWSANFEKLQELIPFEKLPITNTLYFRFESHGDIGSVVHARNYVRIAKKNPLTTFVLWSKNYDLVSKALDIEGKPANFILIISSPFVDIPLDIAKYPYADKIFTVYSERYAFEHGVSINCGGADCLTCLACYLHNDIVYINELLK